jgi:hypothetical protein
VAESLRQEFRRLVEEIVGRHPTLPHELSADGSHLRFPRQETSGFDIEVEVDEHGILVQALGAHEHFQAGASPTGELCARALGLVRDLLSPDMRIRESRAGDKPVRWTVEARAGGEWRSEGQTGLLFFNYFATRTERIYQNRQLPGRLPGAG